MRGALEPKETSVMRRNIGSGSLRDRRLCPRAGYFQWKPFSNRVLGFAGEAACYVDSGAASSSVVSPVSEEGGAGSFLVGEGNAHAFPVTSLTGGPAELRYVASPT